MFWSLPVNLKKGRNNHDSNEELGEEPAVSILRSPAIGIAGCGKCGNRCLKEIDALELPALGLGEAQYAALEARGGSRGYTECGSVPFHRPGAVQTAHIRSDALRRYTSGRIPGRKADSRPGN